MRLLALALLASCATAPCPACECKPSLLVEGHLKERFGPTPFPMATTTNGQQLSDTRSAFPPHDVSPRDGRVVPDGGAWVCEPDFSKFPHGSRFPATK